MRVWGGFCVWGGVGGDVWVCVGVWGVCGWGLYVAKPKPCK
jgi:hypothetical protein